MAYQRGRHLISGILFLACVAFSFLATARTSEAQQIKLALLIANQDYPLSITKLENPIRDISLIGQSLENDGFHVDQVTNATRPKMLRAVRDFASKLAIAAPGSVGFFYYAGHGMAKTGTSENYLLPTNVTKLDEDAWDYSVRLDEIQTILRFYAPFSRIFLVIDACRDELKVPMDNQIIKTFGPIKDASGMFLAFSTDWGRTATDWPGHENGPFAKALSQYLATPGINHREVFQRAKERVYELTSHSQEPVEVNGMRGDVFFGGESATTPPEKYGQPPSPAAYAQNIWELVKDGSDPAVFERFATNYADTPHADEARVKAASLRKSSPNVTDSSVDVRSKWPSYQKGDLVVLYIKTKNLGQGTVKVLFDFGGAVTSQVATYDAKEKALVAQYRLPSNVSAGSYKIPVLVEDQNSRGTAKAEINIEIGLSRTEWTASYMQPAPGQPALIPTETNSVVVASPENNAAFATLSSLCNKYRDINFAMYTSVRADQSNPRYQIEIAYNMPYESARQLKAYAYERGIAKDPYILTYKWASRAESYYDCFTSRRSREPNTFWVTVPSAYPYRYQ